MPFASDSAARVDIDGTLPAGWSTGPHESHLVLTGPLGAAERQARIEVEVGASAGSIEDTTERLIESLRSTPSGRLVVSCDVWPHRQWGTGRLVQTAHLDRDTTVAHDVYVFVDGDRELRITVQCALADLLCIEDDVARIVAQVRTTTPQAGRIGSVSRRSVRADPGQRHLRVSRGVCGAGRGAGAL